jgi:small subunit ribosomal protein S14
MATAAQKSKVLKKLRMASHPVTARLRKELKEKIIDMNLSEEERQEAVFRLTKMKKNGSKVRHRNRCQVTGRPRGFMGKFGVSRLQFRELVLMGEIPGVTKASW